MKPMEIRVQEVNTVYAKKFGQDALFWGVAARVSLFA
jgi:hypothetical protein